MAGKARSQIVKDYVASRCSAAAGLPARSGTGAGRGEGVAGASQGEKTFSAREGDFTANIVRNVWAHAIIFCGHFPDQTYTFSEEEVADETRGGWYVRQLLGAANIEGGPLFHVISGNLGYQVEHHLFPDMPSTRYAEIAPKVKASASATGSRTTPGPFLKQLGMVQRTILRLAFPGGKPRPKPGAYRGGGDDRPRRSWTRRRPAAEPVAAPLPG